MIRFLLRRTPSLALVVVATSVLAFLLPRLTPGDPAVQIAGPEASPEQLAALRADLGLDQPVLSQYVSWVRGIFQGDLGESLQYRRPVAELIGARLESTLELAIGAFLILVVVGFLVGILGGSTRSGRGLRFGVDLTNTVLLATPPFLAGLLLILLLGITFPVLPTSGEIAVLDDPMRGIQFLILPAVALAVPTSSSVSRLVQTSMQRVRGQDYVDLAVAKGVPPRRITVRHVLRNSMGAPIVALGMRFGDMLAGAVIIEAIFARDGLGLLAVNSVQAADYSVIQVLIVGAVVIAVVMQLVTEIGLAALDPRVRLGD